MQTLTQPTNEPLSEDEAQQAEASVVAAAADTEEAERHRGLDELTAEAQKLGMY